MTLDPETKEYVDRLFESNNIKFAAFLSSLCNVLEEKGLITREDFDDILNKSKALTMQTYALGGAHNYINSTKELIAEMEKLKRDILENAKDRKDWKDLK